MKLIVIALTFICVNLGGCNSHNYDINSGMSKAEKKEVMRRAALDLDRENVTNLEKALIAIEKTITKVDCEEMGKILVQMYGNKSAFLIQTGLKPDRETRKTINSKGLPQKELMASAYMLGVMRESSGAVELEHIRRCDADDLHRIKSYYDE